MFILNRVAQIDPTTHALATNISRIENFMQQTIRMQNDGEIDRGEAETMLQQYGNLYRSTMAGLELHKGHIQSMFRFLESTVKTWGDLAMRAASFGGNG